VRDEVDPKYVLAYLYNDDKGPNFDFKALSVEPELQNIVFMAVAEPS
jgi:hypothetical protein